MVLFRGVRPESSCEDVSAIQKPKANEPNLQAEVDEDLIILTLLTNSTVDAGLPTPKPSDLHSFNEHVAKGALHYHDMFRNWYTFLPPHARKKLQVLCLDEDSVKFVHGEDPSIKTIFRKMSDVAHGKWIARIETIWDLLRQGKTVLQSDVDALWLKDPLPYLSKTSEQVVSMREFTDWHEPNAGFVLFRPPLEDFMHRWNASVFFKGLGAFEDNRPLLFAYHDQAQWQPELEDTSSVGQLWGVSVRLLPVHLFSRVSVDMPECTPPHMVHSQEEFLRELPCIGDELQVLHNRGKSEIYRSKMSKNHRFWRVPTA